MPQLSGLLDETDHPDAVRLGAVTRVTDVDRQLLLDRLADPARPVGRNRLRRCYALLAGADVTPPTHVRAVVSGEVRVVPVADAVVVDRPDLVARVAPYAVLPVPLDLAPALVVSLGVAAATALCPDLVLPGGPEQMRIEAPTLGGSVVEVSWAVCAGRPHWSSLEGRAQALAWRAGDWGSRHAVLARLRGDEDPGLADLDPVVLGESRTAGPGLQQP